jgi:hypothetical protein
MKKILLIALIFCTSTALKAQDYIQIHVDTPEQSFIMDATLGADHMEFPNPVSGELAKAFDGVSGPADNDTWSPEGFYCCDSIINGDEIAGKVALIGRGSCSFFEKTSFAWAEGATACVIWNRAPIGILVGTHVDGLITMTLAGIDVELIDIPSYFISHEDGLTLSRLMEDGPVTVTFDTPSMYDAVGPYAYATPVDQIRPLDEISVATFTRDLDTLYNVTFNCVITDPNGTVTTLTTEVAELLPGKDATGTVLEPIVEFDSYTPPAVTGLYSMVFTAETTEGDHALDNTVIDRTFEITDHTFALENADVTDLNGIRMSDAIHSDLGDGLFNMGAFYKTAAAGTATQVSFAIANPAEITADGTYDFIVKIYDADPNGTGQVDPLFFEGDELGEGTYEMNFETIPNEIVTAVLDSPVPLEADKIYAVVIDAGQSFEFSDSQAAFTNGGDIPFPGENTFAYVGTGIDPIAESDGLEYWNDDATLGYARAGVHPVIRLHLDGFVGVDEIIALNEDNLVIGPNPAQDILYLNFDLDSQSDLTYVVTDIQGKQIANGTFNAVHQNQQLLDVSNYSPGTYMLRIQSELGDTARKFVVTGK